MKKTIMIVLLFSSICFGQQGGGGQQAPPQNPPGGGGGQQGGGRQPGGQPNIPDRTAPQAPITQHLERGASTPSGTGCSAAERWFVFVGLPSLPH